MSFLAAIATVAGCNQAIGIGPPHEAVTDLAITVDATTALAGQAFTYHVVVTDLGPDAAFSPSLVDTLPEGTSYSGATGDGWTCSEDQGVVTCTRPWLDAGASADLAIQVVAPPEAVTLVDIATVASPSPDVDESNNTITTTTTTIPSSDLAIGLTTAVSSVSASAPLSYTISVNNNGPSTASRVIVTLADAMSSGLVVTSATGDGWSCGGTPWTCTTPALAPGRAPDLAVDGYAPAEGGLLVETATVTSDATDLVPANNTASATTIVAASSDLSVAVTGAPDPVTASGTIVYTIGVDNLGPSTADQVMVAISQPSGSSLTFVAAAGSGWSCSLSPLLQCTRPSLAVGSAPITVTARAPSEGGVVIVEADVAAATADPVATNNTASTAVTVDPSADLSITLSTPAGPFVVGGAVTYFIGVANAGPSIAGSATVTDTLPAGATFVSASGTGWGCSVAGQVVTCSTAAIASSAAPLSIQITAPTTPGTITNTATVTSSTPDPSTANNTATLQTSIASQTSLVFARTDIATGSQPMFLATADVNGDGRPDLAITTAGVPAITPASVSVVLNTTAATDTTPSFSSGATYLANQSPGSIMFGDINGDGLPDLVATTSPSSFSVLLNTTATNATVPSFASAVGFGSSSGGQALGIADINRDGKPDVVVVGGSALSVYLNTTAANATTPTFSANVDFATGLVPFAVAFGDIDGDGAIDVAVANESSNTVSLFRNTTAANATTPSFATRVDLVTGTGTSPAPYSVAIADIDGDGKPDLAVANAQQSVSTVSTFLNTTVANSGTVAFAPKLDLGTGSGPTCVAMGDLDNDGKPDLAVTDFYSSSVSVFRNLTASGATSPAFALKEDVSVGASPRFLVIEDFDGDGRRDLAVSNQGASSVSILLAR